MDKLTPAEAMRRFGDLLHRGSMTYKEFDDPERGIWRPVYVEGKLDHYRLYKLHKVARTIWRKPKRR